MATNTYKCNVCKRDIETLENKKGIDIASKCIITKGCVGKLHKTKRNPDNLRESFPKFDPKFDNYAPRRSLHTHTQKILSDKWRVKHDLGVFPSISVYEVSLDGKSYAEVNPTTYKMDPIDHNTVSVEFGRQVKGIAQFAARSSVQPRPALVADDFTPFQVTVGGTFVFAVPKYTTKSSTGDSLLRDLREFSDKILIEVVIEKPNEGEITCFETFPVAQEATPWIGWDAILLRKRREFYTFSKNILNFVTFNDSELTFSDIPEGTRLRFTRIDYGLGVKSVIEGEGLLMMLSQPPYTASDKIKNRLIDLGDIVGDPDAYFVYRNGEFTVNEKYVEHTYPLIEKAKTNPSL